MFTGIILLVAPQPNKFSPQEWNNIATGSIIPENIEGYYFVTEKKLSHHNVNIINLKSERSYH
jgi:hypothetical protein